MSAAGSFTRTVGVARGDIIHADYGPLGSSSARPATVQGLSARYRYYPRMPAPQAQQAQVQPE